MELDRLLRLTLSRVRKAKVADAVSLPASVSDVSCDFECLFVEVDRLLRLTQCADPRLPRLWPSLRLSPMSRAISSACSLKSIVFCVSPSGQYADPRLPRLWPSLRLSSISWEMLSACMKKSIDRRGSPRAR